MSFGGVGALVETTTTSSRTVPAPMLGYDWAGEGTAFPEERGRC